MAFAGSLVGSTRRSGCRCASMCWGRGRREIGAPLSPKPRPPWSVSRRSLRHRSGAGRSSRTPGASRFRSSASRQLMQVMLRVFTLNTSFSNTRSWLYWSAVHRATKAAGRAVGHVVGRSGVGVMSGAVGPSGGRNNGLEVRKGGFPSFGRNRLRRGSHVGGLQRHCHHEIPFRAGRSSANGLGGIDFLQHRQHQIGLAPGPEQGCCIRCLHVCISISSRSPIGILVGGCSQGGRRSLR